MNDRAGSAIACVAVVCSQTAHFAVLLLSLLEGREYVRRTAWWGREDTNPQPSGYEPDGRIRGLRAATATTPQNVWSANKPWLRRQSLTPRDPLQTAGSDALARIMRCQYLRSCHPERKLN